jgi:hypothetical protein
MVPNELKFENDDEQKIASMLAALKRVEAPTDFELRLKGRIARGAPTSASRPALMRWVRYAALSALAVCVAALLAFNSFFGVDNAGVPPLADAGSQPALLPIAEPTVEAAAFPSMAARERQIAPAPIDAVSRTSTTRRERPSGYVRDSSSRSLDTGLGITNKVLQPRGIPVDPRIATTRNDDGQTDGVSVRDILAALGVAAEKMPDGWSIKAITVNSQAEKAGLRTTDLVEAVGPHEVKAKDSLRGSVSFDSVTIVRGGKRLVIKLPSR